MPRYEALAGRVEPALRRVLRVVRPGAGMRAEVDGQAAVLWCSNDYLGLSQHPDVLAARGGGAGAARLLSGNRPAHVAVEEALEGLHGRPALIFSSGYHANLALFGTVPRAGDVVVSDALNHASIIDGLRLSPAERVVVPHLSPAVPDGARLLAVEGLYSMDGDVPPFAAYPREPWLAVDEAHAVGALGPQGLGCAAAAGVTPDFLVGTLGKAYGAAGAFVVGPPELKELLVSRARAFVYTTGMPESVACMALAGLRAADDERRARLAANTTRLRRGLAQAGVRAEGAHHIVPVVTGPRTMEVAAALLDRGVYAAGIRYPTVARGAERIRLSVSAAHTEAEVDRCVEEVARACRSSS